MKVPDIRAVQPKLGKGHGHIVVDAPALDRLHQALSKNVCVLGAGWKRASVRVRVRTAIANVGSRGFGIFGHVGAL